MKLYEPFKDLNFSKKHCFLCGRILDSVPKEGLSIQPIFPEWFMDRYHLHQKPFRLLNESFKNYGELKIPCCQNCQTDFLDPLEKLIKNAFEMGYSGMQNIDPWIIFIWVSKIMYGIIYLEISLAIEDQELEQLSQKNDPEPLGISPSLLIKFSQVHLFLQSLRLPMHLEEFSPFSLWVLPVRPDVRTNPFEYRDDMSTLIFSLSAEDFGLIICLQDNEMNKLYHSNLLANWENKEMDFQQFQEFRARIFYSAFLFIPIPDYLILPPVSGEPNFSIVSQPLPDGGKKALFKPWNNETYAQVLEAFWKPWGISKIEILKDPERPLSVLEVG